MGKSAEPREKVFRKKRKRGVEIVGADGEVEAVVGEEEEPVELETPKAKAKRLASAKIIRRALRNQAHKAPLPHLERPDVNVRLRRIATKGIVQLFNAVAQLQKEKTKQKEDEELMKPKKTEKIIKASVTGKTESNSFLDMLKKGTASKLHQEQERRLAKQKAAEADREAHSGFQYNRKRRKN